MTQIKRSDVRTRVGMYSVYGRGTLGADCWKNGIGSVFLISSTYFRKLSKAPAQTAKNMFGGC